MYSDFTLFKNCQDISYISNILVQDLKPYFQLETDKTDTIPSYLNIRKNILEYKSCIYMQKDNLIVYLDNTIEGSYHSMIKSIALANKLEALLCCISHDEIYPGYKICSFLNGNERVVYALKENQWTFYEEGEVRWFENTEYYKNKKITQKFNYAILTEYLKKQNIMIEENSFWEPVSEVTVFSRKSGLSSFGD